MELITGPACSGKTMRLIARAQELAAQGNVAVCAPTSGSLRALRGRADQKLPIYEIEDFAFEVLAKLAAREEVERIDDVDASILFGRGAESLLKLEWAEFLDDRIDPEVPGLRSPTRFLDAAFRLIRKLRDASIEPSQFLETALRGATQFYAQPPNFAHPDLLYYTKDSHRNSLDVAPGDLQQQYRREVDLAKIIEGLFRAYLQRLVKHGCLTATDAMLQATEAAKERGADAVRKAYPFCCVDDAQELTPAAILFLQAIYGDELQTVVLAADAASATSTFSGARPDRVLALPAQRTQLEESHVPQVIERAARHLLGEPALITSAVEPAATGSVTLFRASTPRAEAEFIAEHVIKLLKSGTSPRDIALIFRSVSNVSRYEHALLSRNINVHVAGDVNLFTLPDTLDAMAYLWVLFDPTRHEWLLRLLCGPALGLSDATIAVLCSEPEASQAALFEDMAPEEAPGWDRKRDVRLAWNVLRGDADGQLHTDVVVRLQDLRSKLERWNRLRREVSLGELARRVFSEGIPRRGAAASARAAAQLRTLKRLLQRIDSYAQRYPQSGLQDLLEYASLRMQTPLEACEELDGDAGVRILNIDAARGCRFAHVIIPNARAGAFPQYYVPEAFLYSPTLGMIAKENVGDARAPRTAKFSYYMFRAKTREAYNREERRAFCYAMRRSAQSLLVTASERTTRGITAPEFLTELQNSRLEGIVDLSDKWRPEQAVWQGPVEQTG